MKIFTTSSYLSFFKDQMNLNKGIRGYQARIAGAVGVHSSYLTRVLNGSVHLTPDQAANLCDFWNLGSDETDYFTTLVNLARAGTSTLRKLLQKQLEEIRIKSEDLSRHFTDAETIQQQGQSLYYTTWYLPAIHMLLLVPGYQTIEAITGRLQISRALATSALQLLEGVGLASKDSKNIWTCKEMDMHLSNRSLWASIHHVNWRQRSTLKIQELDAEALHFSGVHTLSKKDFVKLKHLLIQYFEQFRKIAGPSDSEDIFYIGADLYKI
jgi:uncharacterized protein (TIGR02147 family)